MSGGGAPFRRGAIPVLLTDAVINQPFRQQKFDTAGG